MMTVRNAERKRVEKAWGYEEPIVNTPDCCGKRMGLKHGFRCSMHQHKVKDETFYIASGVMRLELNASEYDLGPGDSVRIRPGDWHRFSAYHGPVVFFEFSTHDSPADSYRTELSGPIPNFPV